MIRRNTFLRVGGGAIKFYLCCQIATSVEERYKQVLTYRYRSITKQFFRKADGVIVMYDITAKDTFTAVKQWLISIEVTWCNFKSKL